MQARLVIFFDFLKILQFNDLHDFRPFRAKKKVTDAPKKIAENAPPKARRTARILAPVLVHPKLEKSRVKFFNRQKKQKVDRASEKKYAQWLH